MLFHEIFWEQGGIWLLLLAMTVGFIIRQVFYVIDAAKGKTPKSKSR